MVLFASLPSLNGWFELPSGDDVSSSIINYLYDSVKGAVTDIIDSFLDISVEIFFTIENPHGHDAAQAAWRNSFEVALAIFPIVIILGLLSMPFADEQKTKLWRQGLRTVGVIVIIAMSQPLIGFGVELSNIMTRALMMDGENLFEIADAWSTVTSAGATAGATVVVMAVLGVKYIVLVIIALLIAIIMLQLRTFIVYVVFIASPILAVFWYADWGIMKSVNEFANRFARMAIYAMLVGPIVAIVQATMVTISFGGLDGGNAMDAPDEWVSALWTQMVLVVMFPLLLIAIIWKLISWSGEPLGVGTAMNGMMAGAMAAVGKGMQAFGGDSDISEEELAGAAAAAAGGGGGAAAGGATATGPGPGAAASASAEGSLSDVVNQGEPTVSAAESAAPETTSNPSPGMDKEGQPVETPDDSVAGGGETSKEEPQGYMAGLKNRYGNWKERNSEALNSAISNYTDQAKDDLKQTNAARFMANNQEKQAEKISQNHDQFRRSYDTDLGHIDLDDAYDAGAIEHEPAQGLAELDDGEFSYVDENGNEHTEHIGKINQDFREQRQQKLDKAESYHDKADSIDQAVSKRAQKLSKDWDSIKDKGKRLKAARDAAATAFVQESIRGTVGSHSPYLMQGSGYGGAGSGGSAGGARGGGARGGGAGNQAQGQEEGVGNHPETSVSASTAENHSEMLTESGERFDLNQEYGFKPVAESAPDGSSQIGELTNPETGESVGRVSVGEDADFALTSDSTARLGNVQMVEGEDGEARFHVDENSRVYGENEARVDEIVGNPSMEGENVNLSNVTLREVDGNPENYEESVLAEDENGNMMPVYAETEEQAEAMRNNIGNTVDLSGEVDRKSGMTYDVPPSHRGEHDLNTLVLPTDSAEKEGGPSSETTSDGDSGGDTPGGGGGGDGPGGEGPTPEGTSGGGSRVESGDNSGGGFGLKDEYLKSDSSSPEPRTDLNIGRLNRGDADPTMKEDRAVEGTVVENEDGQHELEDPNTGTRVSSEQITDSNNEILDSDGKFKGDVETGDKARIENVSVADDGQTIQTGPNTGVSVVAEEEEGGSETSGGETGSGETVESPESNGSSDIGISPTGNSEKSSAGEVKQSSGSSDSAAGIDPSGGSETEQSSSSQSYSSGTESVSGEQLVTANNDEEDLPYKVAPEGHWVYEDTYHNDLPDDIAARGIFHKADEDGNVIEGGESFGYVRFGSEHVLDDEAPTVGGEKRDPQGGELVTFDPSDGVETRQWAAEEGFGAGDPKVIASSGVPHGGEEGAVTTKAFNKDTKEFEEIEASPENQYMQISPTGGTINSHGRVSQTETSESTPTPEPSQPTGGTPNTENETASEVKSETTTTVEPSSEGSTTPETGSATNSTTVESNTKSESAEVEPESSPNSQDAVEQDTTVEPSANAKSETESSENSETGVFGTTVIENGSIETENIEGIEPDGELEGETATVEGVVDAEDGFIKISGDGGDQGAVLIDESQSYPMEIGEDGTNLEGVSEGDSVAISNAQVFGDSNSTTIGVTEESEIETKAEHQGNATVSFDSETESEFEAETEIDPDDDRDEPGGGGHTPQPTSQGSSIPTEAAGESDIEVSKESEEEEDADDEDDEGGGGTEAGDSDHPSTPGSGAAATGESEGEATEGSWEEKARNWREHSVETEIVGSENDGNALSVAAGALTRGTFEDGSDVYVTDYDAYKEKFDEEGSNGEYQSEKLKHQTLVGHEWTEAMGHEVPNVAYNESENEIVQEEVGGPDTETWAIEDAPDEALENIDREEFEETMAVQLLGGNFDTTPNNIHVDEKGELYVMDFDRTADLQGEFQSPEEMGFLANGAGKTGKLIGKVNDDFHTDEFEYEDEIADKAAEIAGEIEKDGEIDDLIEPIEELDERMDGPSIDKAPIIRNNIETAAEAAPEPNELEVEVDVEEDEPIEEPSNLDIEDPEFGEELEGFDDDEELDTDESELDVEFEHSGSSEPVSSSLNEHAVGSEANVESKEEVEQSTQSETDQEASVESEFDDTESKLEELDVDLAKTQKQAAKPVGLNVGGREELVDNLAEKHGEDTIRRFSLLFAAQKESSGTYENSTATLELAAAEAVGAENPPRQDANIDELEVSEEEVELFEDLFELSEEFIEEEGTDPDGEYKVYRGMRLRTGGIGAALFDDPEAEEVEMPEKETLISYTPDDLTADGFSGTHKDLIRDERDATDHDFAMLDGLLTYYERGDADVEDLPDEAVSLPYPSGWHPALDQEEQTHEIFPNQHETETAVVDVETLDTENLTIPRYERNPAEAIESATENPDEAHKEEHNIVSTLVNEMADENKLGIQTPESEKGVERLKEWGEHRKKQESGELAWFQDRGEDIENVNKIIEESDHDIDPIEIDDEGPEGIGGPEVEFEEGSDEPEYDKNDMEDATSVVGSATSNSSGLGGGELTDQELEEMYGVDIESIEEESGDVGADTENGEPEHESENEGVVTSWDEELENWSGKEDSSDSEGVEIEHDEEGLSENAGLDEYTPEDIEHTDSMSKVNAGVGNTLFAKEVVEFEDGTQAVHTDTKHADEELGERAVTSSVFARELWDDYEEHGVPEIHGEPEEGYFFTAVAPGEDANKAPEEHKEAVDEEQFYEHAGKQLLLGNNDANAHNVKIDEEGGLHWFDMDHAGGDIHEESAFKKSYEYDDGWDRMKGELVKTANEIGIEGDDEEIEEKIVEHAIEEAEEIDDEKLEEAKEKAEEHNKEFASNIINNILDLRSGDHPDQ